MTKLEKLIRERAYPKGNCIPDEYFMGIDHAASVFSASEDWARSKGVASAMSVMKQLITEETIADGE